MSTALALSHPTTDEPHDAVQRVRVEIRSLLRRARAVIRTSEASVDLDLDTDTFEVLAHVVTRPGGQPSEVAASLHLDDGSARRHIIELLQLGLISHIADVRRPSQSLLVPTAMGRRIHAQGSDAATRALTEVLAGWTPDEVETLTRLLARLNGSSER